MNYSKFCYNTVHKHFAHSKKLDLVLLMLKLKCCLIAFVCQCYKDLIVGDYLMGRCFFEGGTYSRGRLLERHLFEAFRYQHNGAH